MYAIEVDGVSRAYQKYSDRHRFKTFKSALLSGSFFRSLRPDELVTALDNVTFSVPTGTTVGVIGENGSGKSTLLKLVAGISKPTAGRITVHGKVSALIELGAGFHPEITGRENVFINGIMLGLTKKEIAAKFDDIVRFAELEPFIDAPVKTYSSGMYMRLGFSVAINVNPDILLIDEVLAVGDAAFVPKCLDRIDDFRRRQKTILFVSHDLSTVAKVCDRVVWLKRGRVMTIGEPQRVVDAYLQDVAEKQEKAFERQVAAAPLVPSGEDRREDRWGKREVEITKVRLKGLDGQEKHVFSPDEGLEIEFEVAACSPTDDFVFGIGLFNSQGISCYGTNTSLEEFEPVSIKGEGRVAFRIERLGLINGTYYLDVAVHKRDGYPYDYHRNLYSFLVSSTHRDVGIARPVHSWSFSPGIEIKTPGAEMRRGAGKIKTAAALVKIRRRLRAEGKTVVFTNGCFDLIHAGHVRLFHQARSLGDTLIVALNSDASIRRLKGRSRPVFPLPERLEILEAVEDIDYLTSFSEDTPRRIIASILPDVLVKGGDWKPDQVVGRAEVEGAGGRVVIVPYLEGRSTSSIIRQSEGAGRR